MEDEDRCPKCGTAMRILNQKMAVETKEVKILLLYGCPSCGTTVEYNTNVDRVSTPWVKKTVYRGAALEFVYSEE